MSRKMIAAALPVLVSLALGGVVSCRSMQRSLKEAPADPPEVTPTQLDYVDADGFDALFETALTNQDPVILVRTGRPQPDWGARLNAWIAAWNRGDNAQRRAKAPPPVVRGQAPLGKVLPDGESIREFRLLVTALLDRVEEAAQSGSSWWAEERMRSRRVALLRPYSLRFHMDEEGLIQLVFFHGNYASAYPRFIEQLTRGACEEKWSRGVECSCCKGLKGKLISREGAK